MLKKLKEMIDTSENIVFFGGAGVSTESGIPDFRSVDGLYHQKYQYPPETMLSHTFFETHTEEFYAFYQDKLINLEAKPNFAHHYLVELEKQGKLRAIVTQNIDNLHYLAGSKEVYELHGSVARNYCVNCHKFYYVEDLLRLNRPYCDCGGLIKPDVVLYEEGLPEKTVHQAVKAIQDADMLLIAGTSLAVYPAASFVNYYRGNKLVVINKTPLSLSCDLVIEGAIAETLQKVSQL
ncbi:MAG: NAD-dependent protein deacylase [Eubacteriales bacterium]